MYYLNEYTTFDDTVDLNKSIYLHIRNNTHLLNDTDRTALKMIARYAVKYAGVAHLKAETVAGFIDRSTKTARRVIDKLCDLNIIQKIATLRKVSGGCGANIIAVLPAEEDVQERNFPDVQDGNVQSSTSNRGVDETSTHINTQTRNYGKEPSYFIKQLTSTKPDTPSPVPSDALRSALPHAIYKTMSPFFSAEELYRYYGLLLKAKRKICPNTLIEHDAEPYIEAFHAVMLKVKQCKVKSIEKYLYVAFERAASEVGRRGFAMSDRRYSVLGYNWLN